MRCDEKNLREHAVFNVCGVIITTNHKADGIYLPADDRRHYVAWSERTKEEFDAEYWRKLYGWYQAGGYGLVAACLASLDLSSLNPKDLPPQTGAWREIVGANRAPESAELADALELLGNPPAVTIGMVADKAASESFREFLLDRRNARQIPHRLEEGGYVPVYNDADKRDGQWKIGSRRQTVYGRRDLSLRDRIAAAMKLAAGSRMR